MWIRKRFDISERDLAWAAVHCVRPGSAAAAEEKIQTLWQSDQILVTLSVRSGWDLLLAAARWQAGDEVILSGLTIPDMPRIVREHGLIPVGVDVDPATLAASADAIESRITGRTRAILVAHLFGGLCDLGPVAAVARRHGLMLIEDCAQAWTGNQQTGDRRADVSLFSFGPIKTNTALAGGVVEVRQESLLAEMKRLHAAWPRQSPSDFLRRVLKFQVLKIAATRPGLASISRLAAVMGSSHDALVSRAAHGFSGAQFFNKIRRRPAGPLLDLLYRKLVSFDPERVRSRQQRGQLLAASLSDKLPVPGISAVRQTWWVLAVLVDRPQPLIGALWRAGFDATQTCSLKPVCGRELPVVKRMLEHLVFLPFDLAMPAAEQQRMAELVLASDALPPTKGSE